MTRVLVRSFYVENTSFFLLVVGLAGGFMSKIEHMALAEFFISSPPTLLIPFFAWTFYAIKITNFNAVSLKRAENEFLLHFILYPRVKQWLTLIGISFLLFIPAILYGSFLIAVAKSHGQLQEMLLIAVSLIVICIAICFSLLHRFHNPNREKKIGALTRLMNRYFIRPYFWYVIEWISRRQPIMLFGAKVFGGILLFGILKLYTTDTYDSRLLGMAMVIVSAASSQLIFEMHKFDNFHFSLARQLPISFWKRIFYVMASLICLSILETGLLISYFPPNLSALTLIEAIFLLYSCQLFLYGILYRGNTDHEKQMKFVFIFSMVLIVLILFKIPLIALALFNICIGVFYWIRFYYRFELISETK